MAGLLALPGASHADPLANAKGTGILASTSAIDKFLGLEAEMKALGKEVDWGKVFARYNIRDARGLRFRAERLKDAGEVRLCLALGLRITDGVAAIEARDLNSIKTCAEDIEDLSRMLGLTADQLGRIREIRRLADNEQWNLVYRELGFLQDDVLRELGFYAGNPNTSGGSKDPALGARREQAVLVLLGVWVQGGLIVSDLLLQDYAASASSILREPRLLDQMLDELEGFSDERRNDEIVQEFITKLKEVRKAIDIPINGTIPKEDVESVFSDCFKLRESIVRGHISR